MPLKRPAPIGRRPQPADTFLERQRRHQIEGHVREIPKPGLWTTFMVRA